jgi:hypothetical protein
MLTDGVDLSKRSDRPTTPRNRPLGRERPQRSVLCFPILWLFNPRDHRALASNTVRDFAQIRSKASGLSRRPVALDEEAVFLNRDYTLMRHVG